MCAKESHGAREAEKTRLFARIPESDNKRLEEYAEQRGLSKAAALSQMIRIVTEEEGMGETVREIDDKLERVLSELNAPGVGAEISEEEIVADGAVRAHINYDELAWNHTEALQRDAERWQDTDVVTQTPGSRIPVVRGILREELEKFQTIRRDRLQEEIMEIFGCTPQTADGYIDTGFWKSWFPDPHRALEDPEELDALLELLEESGANVSSSIRTHADLFRESVESDGEPEPLWNPSDEIILTQQYFDARIRQLISRLRAFLLEHPRSGKTKLMLQRVLAFGEERTGPSPQAWTREDTEALRAELSEEGAELPSGRWW